MKSVALLTTILLVNFVCSLSFAGTCSDILSKVDRREPYKMTTIVVSSDSNSLSSQKFLERLMNQVAPYLAKMIVPKVVAVVIEDNFVDFDGMIVPVEGHYNPLERKIYLNTPTYLSRGAALSVTFRHELGHQIFFANMAQYSSVWEYVGKNKKKNLKKNRTQIISLPYQELFADLITVVSQQNPQSMSDFLKTKSEFKSRDKTILDSRSFNGPLLNKVWGEKDVHIMLAPVRSYLWENYFSKTKDKNEAAKLLKSVFKVIALEIISRSSKKNGAEMSPEEINLNLLHSLQQELP